jgi:hypothetical protein
MSHAGLFTAAFTLMATTASAEKPKLAVLPSQIEESAKDQVPELFDDYLLAAVQNAGDYEVIGQDDINSMLGFEQQKELFGCDDVSCMADIGGALGVDRLVVVKIARLENDWVTTSKLINITEARVESRSSDFVAGDTKALLQAVPHIVGKLFEGGGDAKSSGSYTPPPAPDPGATQPPSVTSTAPVRRYGTGSKVWGVILAVTGFTIAAIGTLTALAVLPDAGEYVDDVGDTCADEYGLEPDSDSEAEALGCSWEANMGAVVGTAVLYGGGTALAGSGANLYLNGKAQANTGDPGADGTYYLTWLGWALTGISMVGPIVGASIDSDGLAYLTGLGGVIGAGVIWALTMASNSAKAVKSDGTRVPIVSFAAYRDGLGGVQPGFAFTYTF